MPVQGQEQEQEEEQGQEEEEQQGQIEAQTHAGAALPHCTPGMWCVLRQFGEIIPSHVQSSRVLTCPPHITYYPTPPHHTTRPHRHSRHVASVVRRCWSDVVGRVTRLRSGMLQWESTLASLLHAEGRVLSWNQQRPRSILIPVHMCSILFWEDCRDEGEGEGEGDTHTQPHPSSLLHISCVTARLLASRPTTVLLSCPSDCSCSWRIAS